MVDVVHVTRSRLLKCQELMNQLNYLKSDFKFDGNLLKGCAHKRCHKCSY